MASLDDIFKTIGRAFVSRKQSKDIGKKVSSAGMTVHPELLVGYYVLSAFIIGLLIAFIADWWPGIFNTLNDILKSAVEVPPVGTFVLFLILGQIIAFFFIGILLYTLVTLSTERRTKEVEEVLPDYLLLVSSNIKAGMTLDQAMWYAAKPEFGILSEETRGVIKKSFSGQPLDQCLDELSVRFESKVFHRTVLLLKQALATGGEISEVLENTAQDARDSIILKKETTASLVLYEIFVIFAAMVGTPFLFAVAAKLISILEKAFSQLPADFSFQQGLFLVGSFSPVPIITSGNFFWFAIATIFVTSLFSSLIVGVIRTGSKNQGIKYFPVILAVSYVIYFLVSGLLESFFENMFI
ncbi:type II secretion system F family protein [Candidatus Micrarchaeota archaeon]|nr:type II secretion system F family protein [Candidatus Micrarchaeota archaeon]